MHTVHDIRSTNLCGTRVYHDDVNFPCLQVTAGKSIAAYEKLINKDRLRQATPTTIIALFSKDDTVPIKNHRHRHRNRQDVGTH